MFQEVLLSTMKPVLGLLSILYLCSVTRIHATEVLFNRDVRPILSENCFSCHGPDASSRKAELRVDIKGVDLAELMRRVSSTDSDQLMPPPNSTKKPLTPAQIATLEQWIAEGAEYQMHWAFDPLNKTGDDLDAVVEARLKQKGLAIAPEAAHHTLIRRVCLDLTGLPPTDVQLTKPYAEVVDELLNSPHFGEHLAVPWLDAARYADTNGYFGDKPRMMWIWRDWVIDALNANMPFDQFSIEQLAGDLLPNATQTQQTATGFNRNHIANNETGIIDEEFRVEYVVDRVDTTMTTWLGLTAGCAQCHDHKYDPISQREFYQLFAFFNNVPEQGLITSDNPPPLISVSTAEQEMELKQLADGAEKAMQTFKPIHAALVPMIQSWEKNALTTLPALPKQSLFHESFNGEVVSVGTALQLETGLRGLAAKFDATQHIEADVSEFDPDGPWSIGMWVNAEGSLNCLLSIIEPEASRRGVEIIWLKGRVQVNLVNRWGARAIEVATVEALSSKAWHHVIVTYDGSKQSKGLSVYLDASLATLEIRRDSLHGSIKNHEPLRIGRRDSGLGFYGMIDEVRLLPLSLDSQAVSDWFWGERIAGIVETEFAKRGTMENEVLLDYYIEHYTDEPTRRARAAVKSSRQAEKTLRNAIPTTLVMQEMDRPKPTHVLIRGQYDKPGEVVSPGVPTAIAEWKDDLPRNRLGFAKWLFLPENPLTARVAANRLWAHCFGEGLVRTPNDFGSQGEPPTHPDLLDWLAADFRDNGWDVKALLRKIVLSKTYRQRSGLNSADDPENRWLARGPSTRLSAEMLRDQALAISGLLVRQLGGPSVRPFQPPGLWEAVSYNGEETYVPDKGDNLWRRSVYTYIKRQSPHPMLLTFDGPTREKCTVFRPRTNTPLQALLLLNDETFLKAAAALARRSEGQENRIAWMFHTATAREPQTDELQLLEDIWRRRGSLVIVAHTILNLDEVIMKR
jgi:cytochrome c553